MTAMTAVPVTPPDAGLQALLRPLVLLATVAFVVGFLGYLALGRTAVAAPDATASAAIAEPAAAGPASDDGNLPKHI